MNPEVREMTLVTAVNMLISAGVNPRRTYKVQRKSDGLYLSVLVTDRGHCSSARFTHPARASSWASKDDIKSLFDSYMGAEALLKNTHDYDVVECIEFPTRSIPLGTFIGGGLPA